MRNHTTTTQYLTAVAAAVLCIGSAQIASAQTDQSTPPATPAPGASTSPSPTPPAGTATPPAPAPAAPTAPAAAAPAPAPATPQISYTGLVDVYYLYQFNNPNHFPAGTSLGYPEYDRYQNTPTVSLAELNLVDAVPTQGGFGAKATLIAGDTADQNVAGGEEARFKDIQQLYVTYAAKSGAGVDFGKFYTPFGYEVTESNANYNYSRSDVYEDLLPVYHAGFRFYTQNYNGFTGTLYIVNSILDTGSEGVRDDNSDKAFIGVFNFTDPKGKYVAIENIGYSEDIVGGETDKLTLSDTDLTWNVNAANVLGAEYVYRKDDVQSDTNQTSNGYAAYYKYTINPKDNVALRYDYVDQKLLGRPWEITGTYSIQTTPKFLTRIEYRYDKIYGQNLGIPGFAASDGSFTASSQSTVSLSEVFTF